MSERESIIQLIYDGVSDDGAWNSALDMIAIAMRSDGAGLGVQDMTTHKFWAVAQSGIDSSLHQTYERLAPENRIWQAINRAGRPLADQMVMPKAEFLRTALHAEYFVPQGFHSVMAAPVLANATHCGVVVAFGGKARGDFEERDLDDLAGLARHLSRALSLRLDRVRLMEDLAARNRVLDDGEDGIVLLDASLRVIHANLSAKTMLAASDGLTLRQGRLACATPRVDSELQALLRSVLRLNGSPPGSWVALHRKEGAALLLYATRVVSADVSGLLPSTALVVRIKHPERDRSPTPAVLQRLLGLTLGEARAVLAVCQTQSQELAARRVGVARTTLRTQLRHAYQKLGLQDRADLLRLLGRYGFG